MLIFSRYSWWVASMFGLAIFLAVVGQAGLLNPFQGLFLRATAPVESIFRGVFEPVASVLSDVGELGDLRDENDRLRVENEELRNLLAQREQDAQRIKDLESALALSEGDTTTTRLAANVVHRDSSPFSDVITIDRGESSGLQKGMVVTSAQGSLMGTITKVTSNSAFVRLITDTRSNVRAQVVGGTGADGIVKGEPGRTLSLDLAQGEIKVGDQVITAGLGGSYPFGIPIGLVSSVDGTGQDLYARVTIEPIVRLGTTTTVSVITSFLPEQLELEGE